jgi:hypothetical protein
MYLVAMPADADPGVIFGAKHLRDRGLLAAERFDSRHDLLKPWRKRVGRLQFLEVIVIAIAEGGNATLALEWAELERLQRQGGDPTKEVLLDLGGQEVIYIAQALGAMRETFKKGKLLGHVATYGIRWP